MNKPKQLTIMDFFQSSDEETKTEVETIKEEKTLNNPFENIKPAPVSHVFDYNSYSKCLIHLDKAYLSLRKACEKLADIKTDENDAEIRDFIIKIDEEMSAIRKVSVKLLLSKHSNHF